MTKNFSELPPHYAVQVNVEFYTGDTWENEKYGILVDGTEAFADTYT